MTLNAASLILTTFCLCLFGLVLLLSPAVYGYLLMEDTPPEWIGFLLCVGSGTLWAVGAHRRWHQRQALGCLFCLAMGLLCMFVAGEEISWGQRLLGFESPGFFAARNIQGEVTVHNLALPWMRPRRLAFLLVVGYGVVLPVLARASRRVRDTGHRIGIPTPPLGATPAFALTALLLTSPITATDDEVGELFFAVALFAASFEAAGLKGREGARTFLQVSALSAVLAVGLSVLSFTRDEEREHFLCVGPLQAGQAYEGRGMKRAAAREYEKLARYWQTDWDLWVTVLNLTYEAGDTRRAFWLAENLLRIHRREWRVYAILLELGHAWGVHDHVEDLMREVLTEEPANEFAQRAFSDLKRLKDAYHTS